MDEFNGYNETYAVARAMQVYGGSFVKALGKALSNADSSNTQKIKDTWPEYWQQYRQFALDMARENRL